MGQRWTLVAIGAAMLFAGPGCLEAPDLRWEDEDVVVEPLRANTIPGACDDTPLVEAGTPWCATLLVKVSNNGPSAMRTSGARWVVIASDGLGYGRPLSSLDDLPQGATAYIWLNLTTWDSGIRLLGARSTWVDAWRYHFREANPSPQPGPFSLEVLRSRYKAGACPNHDLRQDGQDCYMLDLRMTNHGGDEWVHPFDVADGQGHTCQAWVLRPTDGAELLPAGVRATFTIGCSVYTDRGHLTQGMRLTYSHAPAAIAVAQIPQNS